MPFDPITPAPRPLSILHVLSAFPVLSETFVSNEIRALRRLGHRVVPFALAAGPRPCQPEDEAFRAETLHLADTPRLAALCRAAFHPARVARALGFATTQRGIRPRSLLLAGARVALVAQARGCTHLHAHFAHAPAATAIVAARLAGASVSFTGHGFDIYGAAASDLPAKLAAADLAVAVCDDMAADFRAVAPRASITVVPCGVDPARFRPAPDGRHNGRLLAVGRLAPQKGCEVLIEALARLPEAARPVIDVVGAGDLLLPLTTMARNLGVTDSIRFLGARPSGWIAAEGPRYRGFVAPYVVCADGDRDTGPIVVKEAMAMGLPVLASALMGMREYVTPQTGRTVRPGDAAALAKGLAWLATLDDGQRAMLGAAARRRVCSRYTLEGQAEALAAAIAGVRP